MRVLVVCAHPSPVSLTAALRDVAVDALRSAGHEVEESDLYAMGWDPVLRESDFGEAATIDGPLTDRSGAAYAGATLSADIVAEHDKVVRADLLVLHFPLWWFGMPAILKGWIDRVFVQGFAYGLLDADGRSRKYGDGGLVGKRALVVASAADRASTFAPRGVHGDLGELLFPLLHGTFWYSGMSALAPFFVPGVGRPGWAHFETVAAALRDRLAGIEAEPALDYRTITAGEYGRDRLLREDLRPGEAGLGIHLRRSGDPL